MILFTLLAIAVSLIIAGRSPGNLNLAKDIAIFFLILAVLSLIVGQFIAAIPAIVVSFIWYKEWKKANHGR